jgi:hypothetical protein
MPHLHLPADHTDADLVLAATVAEVVGSSDLYVAWSHHRGPGAVPEVEAVVSEEPPPVRPFAALLASLGGALAALWRAVFTAQAEPARQRSGPRVERCELRL